MKIKIVYMFFLLALSLNSGSITEVYTSKEQCISSWRTISLEDSQNFDANARYRIKVFNDNGTPNSGWIYPVMITPSILYMTVSTAQFAFGAVTSDRKGYYHYRKQGDSANRPIGYENTEWKVAEIQMILE